MQKSLVVLCLLLALASCNVASRDQLSPDTKSVDISVTVQEPQVLKVILRPDYLLPGRIYSLTLLHADAVITFPLPKATQEDKNGAIMVALEETDNGRLTSPFYKKGLLKSEIKDLFDNPFEPHPIRDIKGLPVGSEAAGILYLMSKNVGKGVEMTPKGEGVIDLNSAGEYEFYIHFHTEIPEWKILIGMVHVDIFNPSLDFPTLTPIFNILGQKA